MQAFQYGSTNAGLMDFDYISNQLKIIASNGGTTLSEYTEFTSQQPSWTKSYVYLGGRLLSTFTRDRADGEFTEYNHPDKLSTRIITNQNGFYEQTHLPFGTSLNGETSGTTTKRFTSYERSQRTGLDYAINRTYDSKLARFTQVDPIGMQSASLEKPQTLNLYNYCGNDPINHTDPEGLFWSSIGKFFKQIWKGIVAIAKAIAVILNNKWVQIALFALDFFAMGLGFYIKALADLGKTAHGFLVGLRKVLSIGNKIAGWVSSAVGMIQMADMAIKGKWQELGRGFLWAVAMAPLSALTGALKRGAAKGLFSSKFDELADIFTGAWAELKKTWNALKQAAKTKKGLEWLIPFYGSNCGPGHDLEMTGGIDAINAFDKSTCGWHDSKMARIRSLEKGGAKRWWSRFVGDLRFVGRALINGTGVSGIDIAFGQGSPTFGSRYQVMSMGVFGVRGTYYFGRRVFQ